MPLLIADAPVIAGVVCGTAKTDLVRPVVLDAAERYRFLSRVTVFNVMRLCNKLLGVAIKQQEAVNEMLL